MTARLPTQGFLLSSVLPGVLFSVLSGCGQTATLDAGCVACADVPRADVPTDVPTDASAAPADGGGVSAELARDILATSLAFDVTAHTGRARIQLGPAGSPGAAFEAQGLAVTAVRDDASGAALSYRVDGNLLHVEAPAAATTVVIEYGYHERVPADFQGASASYTLTWPYYCGNVFPCHSDPADGVRFDLALTGVPAGQLAVYPPTIPANAPSYQLAWAIGAYGTVDLGTTPAGTHLTVRYLPADEAAARAATTNLLAAFGWYESTLGPYPFGTEAGSVEVPWGPGAFGGMEHHPLWHIGVAAVGDALTHMHEAAHGWFGDGVRIGCWEDFVLSEGTVNYLASRAMGAVAGDAAEAGVWLRYNADTRGYGTLAWPEGCHQVDILRDHLFTATPYMRGANFYRALERRITRPVLDAVLRRFVAEHRGSSARMTDMLALVRTVSGYDPTACARSWLRPSAGGVRGPDVCP